MFVFRGSVKDMTFSADKDFGKILLEGIEFFGGMGANEAAEEYLRLMNRYHPKNKEGDLIMTGRIIDAYYRFCELQKIYKMTI